MRAVHEKLPLYQIRAEARPEEQPSLHDLDRKWAHEIRRAVYLPPDLDSPANLHTRGLARGLALRRHGHFRIDFFDMQARNRQWACVEEIGLARISDRATLRARGPRDALADEVRAQGLEGYWSDLPDADGGGDSATQWLLPKDNCGPWRAGSQQGGDCRVQKQSRKKRRDEGDPCKKL